MSPIDEPVSSEPKSPAPGRRKPKTGSATAEPAPGDDLVAFTVDAANGRIIKVEGVDAMGAHRELSKDERAHLVDTAAKATLERIVEQAFEAGIDCALGADADEETAESDEDAELSRLLLRSLMERSRARRLMQREVLSRAIVRTLIEQAVALRTATPEGASTH